MVSRRIQSQTKCDLNHATKKPQAIAGLRLLKAEFSKMFVKLGDYRLNDPPKSFVAAEVALAVVVGAR